MNDHLFKAEKFRKKGNHKEFQKHFFNAMAALMEVTERPVARAYDDVNDVRTIGIGFNMSIPDKPGGHDDNLSRRKWNKIFGENGPDFDDCKSGKRALTKQEMKTLYQATLKDSEAYLRRLFNNAVNEYKSDHPHKKFLKYDELPSNHRAALLSIHYQSPRIATRLYDELSSGNVKAASKEMMTRTLAGKYANRRDIEEAILSTTVKTVSVSKLTSHVKAQVDKAMSKDRTVIHAYGVPEDEESGIKRNLKNNKRGYVVTAHEKDGDKYTLSAKASKKPRAEHQR